MKRIFIDCDLMKHPASGLYYYCLNLANEVRSVVDEDKKESVRCYVPPSCGGVFGKQEIIEKKWHHRLFMPFMLRCDLWHATFQTGRMVRKLNPKTKVALTIHDLNVLYEDKPESERRESLARTQELINASNAVICISNHCRNDVEQHMNLRGKLIYVIHNGTHRVAPVPDKPQGYRPSRPFVFGLGYINRKKNFHTLIPLLRDPSIELVLAGCLDEPDYIEMMKKQALEHGVADRLQILGPVSDADKSWYYKHALAFSLPSLAEGFGAPPVEAMGFGKPVFLSSRTALPEIGGDAAFYFKSFEPDHMIKVFREGMAVYNANGMAHRIKARAESFSWKEKARQYVEVYRKLLYD